MPNSESYGLSRSDSEPYENMRQADEAQRAADANYEKWQQAMAKADELRAEELEPAQSAPEKDKNSKKPLFKAKILALCIAVASSFFAMHKIAEKPLPEKPTNTTEQEYHAPSAAQTEERIQELKKEQHIKQAQEDYDNYNIELPQ